MEKGYVHIYTGNGKGKTTSALGLMVRAVGAGKKVYMGQFLKQGIYSEINAIEKYLPNITVEQYGLGNGFVKSNGLSEDDINSAQLGYDKALNALNSNSYDIVILDEINVAVYLGLIPEQDVLDLIEAKPFETELILTGRYARDSFIQKADLVTEMKEVKHYFNVGVNSRIGIEE